MSDQFRDVIIYYEVALFCIRLMESVLLVVGPNPLMMEAGGSHGGNSSNQEDNRPLDIPRSEWQRVRERAITALLRGAAAGLALRGGLHLLSKIAVLLSAREGRRVNESYPRHPVEETARYVAFLGSLGGVYVAADEGLAALIGKERCRTTVNSWEMLQSSSQVF